MKKPNKQKKELNQEESKLIEHLRRHPKMMERFQQILEITIDHGGPLKKADEVEELLIQEMRQLGHASMSEWAVQAEERVSQEIQDKDPTLRSRKKKR